VLNRLASSRLRESSPFSFRQRWLSLLLFFVSQEEAAWSPSVFLGPSFCNTRPFCCPGALGHGLEIALSRVLPCPPVGFGEIDLPNLAGDLVSLFSAIGLRNTLFLASFYLIGRLCLFHLLHTYASLGGRRIYGLPLSILPTRTDFV